MRSVDPHLGKDFGEGGIDAVEALFHPKLDDMALNIDNFFFYSREIGPKGSQDPKGRIFRVRACGRKNDPGSAQLNSRIPDCSETT